MAAALPLLPAAPASTAVESEAAYLFALGQSLRLEGAYREALEALQAAAAADPDEPFLRLELAELLLQLGRLDEALYSAEKARELAPESVAVLGLYGRVLLRKADRDPSAVEEARKVFERIRSLDERDVEARVTLARLYLNLSRGRDAIAPLAEARKLRPRDRLVTTLLVEALEQAGGGAEAEAQLREIVSEEPDFAPALVSLAQMLSRRGEIVEAVQVLEAAPGEVREDRSYLRELALGYYRLGSWQEALDVSRRWQLRSPGDVGARYLMGLSLAALGRDAEAEEQLSSLLAEEPGNADFVRALADVVARQGRRSEAADLLEQAIRERRSSSSDEASRALLGQLLDLYARSADWNRLLTLLDGLLAEEGPVDAEEVRLLRAQALVELDREDEGLAELLALAGLPELDERLRARTVDALFELERNDEAMAALQPLREGDSADSLMLAAEILHRHERFAAAAALLGRANQLRPDDRDIVFWLAASLERDGQREQAERELRRLLAFEPDFAPALNYLGYMLAERGERLDEAVELVQRALAQDPENGAYLDSLGWAFFQLGRLDEAGEYLERAARLVGDDPVVLEHLGDLYRAQGDPARAISSYREALALGGENQEAVRRKLEELGGE